METNFPPKASSSRQRPERRRRLQLVLAFIATTCLQPAFAAPASTATLQPYSAIYSARYKGMSGEAVQTLSAAADGTFTLSRDADAMFVRIQEHSEFRLQNGEFIVSRYSYKRSGLASKKNIEQQFLWDRNLLQVTEKGKSRNVAIKPPLLDKLSYVEAVRLQLLSSGAELPRTISVAFADRHHLKQYEFVVGAQEDIEVPAGKMRAVKLERHVREEDRHTVIWAAPSLDYLVIKLQQTDDGDNYELYLKQYDAK
jgi:uncharacterized protein with FMN-binding domain